MIGEGSFSPLEKPEQHEEDKSSIELLIVEKPERTGEVVADAIVSEIVRANQEDRQLAIAVSGGTSQNRISTALVKAISQFLEGGKPINLDRVTFIQTEVAWPENPNSPSNPLAYQLKSRLEEPLRALGLNPAFYYAGTEPSWEEAKRRFEEATRELDFQVVTLHESGAVKGLRDADDVVVKRDGEEVIEPRYVQGMMQTRHIHARVIDEISNQDPQKIQLGGRVFERLPEGRDVPSRAAFDRYKEGVVEAKKNDPSAEIPYGYLSEGYKSYIHAKKCYVITEGAHKLDAMRRVFKNLRTRVMDEEARQQGMTSRKEDQEGSASGQTVIELRERFADGTTTIVIDRAAAGLLSPEELRKKGIQVTEEQDAELI